MRVRLVTQISGTRNGQDWPPAGTVVDLPDDEARALVTGGAAAASDAEVGTVLVPPAGIHTPGVTAQQAPGVTHLVEAPADAASDPEGVMQALKSRDEGNVTEVPVGVGVQKASGAALTADEVDASMKADEATREALKVTAPKVGESAQAKKAPKSGSDR